MMYINHAMYTSTYMHTQYMYYSLRFTLMSAKNKKNEFCCIVCKSISAERMQHMCNCCEEPVHGAAYQHPIHKTRFLFSSSSSSRSSSSCSSSSTIFLFFYSSSSSTTLYYFYFYFYYYYYYYYYF